MSTTERARAVKVVRSTYVALLRAVNVGGTGKLPMTELRRMCEELGFDDVRTYIASGNVIFASSAVAAQVKSRLEARLATYAGQRIPVVVRTGDEMREVELRNPFPTADPKSTVAVFLDEAPAATALDDIRGRTVEEVRLGKREIYIAYHGGMARSRLKVVAAQSGTARNMNTVATLARLALEVAEA